MNKRVLCLLVDGFEEIETITPVDILRRAGAEVVLASLTEGIHVMGAWKTMIHADTKLEEALKSGPFDLLMIPGGPGVKQLRADGRAAALAQTFVAEGKPVAAICAAPTVLADAGLLAGKRYTAHDSTYAELTQALAQERVVESGGIITSRGAGTALDFGLALAALLCGKDKAAEVASRIMA